MEDTMSWDSSTPIMFGQREQVYTCPIIGSAILYINKLPFEYFKENLDKCNAEEIFETSNKITVKMEDIIVLK